MDRGNGPARTPRRLTDGPWRDSSPAWSPGGDGVAFLSDRDGTTQIWVRRLDNAADRQVTHLESPPLTVAWSPDGASLAYTARLAESPPSAAWAPAAILPLLRRPAARVQLFVIPAAGGAVRALPLDGALDIYGEPAWMPDGQSILVSAAPPPDAANALEGGEIYAVRVPAASAARSPAVRDPD